MQIIITTEVGATDVSGLVLSVRWSGDWQQAARSLDLSVISCASDKSVPVIDCPLGAGVRMSHAGKVLFDGFIVSRQKHTERSELSLSCFDRGFYLKRNRASYKFLAAAPEAIAAQLAGEFGFTLGEVAVPGVPITRNFLAVSLYDILATVYTLASHQTGKQYHIGFVADEFCVREKGPDEHTLVLRGKSNLIAAETTESIERAVSAVAIYDQNGNPVRTVENAELLALYGKMQEALVQTKTDDKAAEAERLLTEGGPTQKITVDCLGNPANVTGGSVVLQEPYTGLYGLFYIDNDLHEWKRGQYYNKLTLNFKSIMDEKEAGSLPNADGSKTAGERWTYVNKPGEKDAG